MTGPGGSAPPRRAFPWLAALAVVVVGLGVGIPVGLFVGADGTPDAGPVATAAPVPTPTVAPTTSPTSPSPKLPQAVVSVPAGADSVAPVTAAPTTGTPGGLSPTQTELWTTMLMGGVDRQSCRGYPAGEAVTASVVASVECDIADPLFTEPVVYYRFADAAAVAEYMALRAAEVDRVGACRDGAESVGEWSDYIGTPVRGTLVCVDNVKEGSTFFKLIWSHTSTDTVVVVQGTSSAATVAWWSEHGSAQSL